MTKTMTEALEEKRAEVANIVAGMRDAGVGDFGVHFAEAPLEHIFHGILLARVQSIEPTVVEDGLINIFCIGISEMMAGRSIPNVEAALNIAQEIINEAAKLLQDQIVERYTKDVTPQFDA